MTPLRLSAKQTGDMPEYPSPQRNSGTVDDRDHMDHLQAELTPPRGGRFSYDSPVKHYAPMLLPDHDDADDLQGSQPTLGRVDGLPPTKEVGAPAAELARNLPDLVEQLKLLRVEMEKCSKVYESLSLGSRASGKLTADELLPEDRPSVYGNPHTQPSCERVSEYTPSRESSFFFSKNGGPTDLYEPESATEPQGATHGVLFRGSSHQRRSQQLQQLPRPSLRMSTVMRNNADYTVMWVSGECGISLRNFSTNKIGAQIAVLQQADGVTTGIANCRLGDQLVTVNEDSVEDLRFKEIVQKLKSTRRPITLGFRTNQNVQTSPSAAARGSAALNYRSSTGLSRGSSASRGFFGASDEDLRGTVSDKGGSFSQAPELSVGDRQTYSSMRSSTSTLSDDVELFCKEQEEMHSDIIVLLTETVMRCEKLQQENLDQLQSLLQLAPAVESPLTPSSKDQVDATISSLAPVASPAVADAQNRLATTTA